ncbi:MAG: HEAT repeat domain-containing protein [Desulfarculaceae bacterium]|nr:HEAT repeat domain-containing protein [Desulfarculaceae bacterium]
MTEQGLELTQVMVVATGKEGQGARYCAIYTLGELRDPRAAELLKAMLHDPDPNVRRMAAHGLGKQGDRSAVMPLVEVLCRQRERVAVRSAAAASLGKLGDRRAVGMLTYCAGDRSGWMRSEALKALSQMEQAQQMQRAGR